MTGSVLKVEGEGEGRKVAYDFTCLVGVGLHDAAQKDCAVKDAGETISFSWIADRHNVDCGDDAAISQIYLV